MDYVNVIDPTPHAQYRIMRQPMPPATPEDNSSDTYSQHETYNQCKVKASIININNTDDEIIKVLAPEIEKFGMIKMTIKIATDDNGKQYRWVVIEFDDIHDFNDFRHYITTQKGTISVFGNVLNFKFLSAKQTQDRNDSRSTRKRKYNQKGKSSSATTTNPTTSGSNPTDENGLNHTEDVESKKIRSASGERELLLDNKVDVDHPTNTNYGDVNSPVQTHDKRSESSRRKHSRNDNGDDDDDDRGDSYSTRGHDSGIDRRSKHYQRYDDKTPTRTLYFGNLDRNVDALKVKRIFSNYGQILDIVVKRQGRFAAYGFVKFLHLKDALEAKNQLTGTYVSRHRMAVGYGSICQTCLIWIGDYTRQIDVDEICREVKKYSDYLDYLLGKDQTYVYFVFKNVQDALKAVTNLRGLRLNGHRYPVQVDFADPKFEATYLYEQHHQLDSRSGRGDYAKDESEHFSTSTGSYDNGDNNFLKVPSYVDTAYAISPPPNQSLDETTTTTTTKTSHKNRSTGTTSTAISNNSNSSTINSDFVEKSQRKSRTDDSRSSNRSSVANNKTTSNNADNKKSYSRSQNDQVSPKVYSEPITNNSLIVPTIEITGPQSTSITSTSRNNTLMSSVLKCSSLSSGSIPNRIPNFSFYKRYPLGDDNLEEFKTNLASAMLCNDYCAFIGLPCSGMSSSQSACTVSPNGSVVSGQQLVEKPLKELITYLTDKNTAVHITDVDPINQLSLFVFPPCDFSREFLSSSLSNDNKIILSLAASSHVLVFVTK